MKALNVFSQNEKNGINEFIWEEYPTPRNDASNPCITPEQYKIMGKQIADNCKMLGLDKKVQKGALMNTSLAWPLRMANGLNDCSYYVVSNYVDQDPTAGIKDYNCGAKTYNGHNGNDITTNPYPFYKMDNNQVEAIAAAPGTIVNKADGNFDKNCALNALNYNYVAVQHADGSQALYIHLKKNSLTPKTIGQTVVAGEFIGVVGSSGNSTGPHLHFEILNPTLYEPYFGPCNVLNPSSWWAVQKPYTEPAVTAIQVNKIAAIFPSCPITETPYADSCFSPGSVAKFYVFMRNEVIGNLLSMRIVNPGGTTFSSWTYTTAATNLTSYGFWNKVVPFANGTYTFETTYNAIVCQKKFTVSNNCPLGINEIKSNVDNINLYPNPNSGKFKIETGNLQVVKIEIYNTLGEIIYESENLISEIDLSNHAKGNYFIKVFTKDKIFNRKLFTQ